MTTLTLFHGTSTVDAARISENGFRENTCFTNSAELAEYYAEERVEEVGGEIAIFEVVIDTGILRVDEPAFEEPLTLYRNEHAASDDEWHDGLSTGAIPSPSDSRDYATALEVTWSVRSSAPVLGEACALLSASL